MWEHVKDENSDMSWARDAMINGTLIAVTDGSYDRERAKDASGLGWILLCTASRRTLRGSFYAHSLIIQRRVLGTSSDTHSCPGSGTFLSSGLRVWKNLLR